MSFKKWSETPYAGESKPPRSGVEPQAGSWPLTYLLRDDEGDFLDPDGTRIKLAIKKPETIDWNQQLRIVQGVDQNLTEEEKLIATYWGTGVPTKQFTPMMDILIDTYAVSPPRATRMLAALQDGLNDAFIVTWNLKYKWDVARPNQFDSNLTTFLCTPNFPAYPSGHSVGAGCTEEILNYFFPAESRKNHRLAEENAQSRLYALVHFPIDNSEGLRLGRQLGRLIVKELKKQKDGNLRPIDQPYTRSKNAKINPDLEQQAIPYDFPTGCNSLLRDNQTVESDNGSQNKPKLYY
ncbi:vanadium-dependent haloperoxidase [Bacillus sp. DJP31]|uniref:vanadium-dependent haloperoxidase n=1 Tax=Bacillus sp. DJP31 TaxID=3409789 RepID=UPI003BB7271F